MITLRKTLILGLVILALALMVPLTAQAAAYTWTGTTSGVWELGSNWGSSNYPSTYSDQATIPYLTTRPTVSLSTTELLGGGGTALTISNKTTTGNVNALDITSSGTLGMQGGISLGTRRTMTIEGILRNDSNATVNPTGAAYTISGTGITLNGGTISDIAGGNGIWNITAPITSTGTSTISAPVTDSGAVTVSSGTLNFTGAGSTISGAITNNGIVNLSGVTLQGVTGLFSATALGGTGAFNVTGTSTMLNNFAFTNYSTMSVATGATLRLNAASYGAYGSVTGGGNMTLNSGATLDNFSGNSTVSQSSITMKGANITNTGGGTFTINDTISGYGSVSGVTSQVGGVTASGGTVLTPQTLVFDGGSSGTGLGSSSGSGQNFMASANNTLDLKGKFNYVVGGNMNPSGGVIQLDGVTISGSAEGNSGLPTSGSFQVTNASTLQNAFSIGNGANLQINAPLTVNGGGSINGTNDVAVNTGGSLNLLNTNSTMTPTLTARSLTMAQTTPLTVAANNQIELTGNFSFQQTNPSNWTNGSTAGLGPDLKMAGTAVQTLEVGGVNLGATLAGMTNNFALNSLTIAPGADVKLVDLFQNATTGTWTPGSEALYLGALNLGAAGDPTFDLNGLWCYVNGVALTDGMFNGITIMDAPSPVPIPPSTILLGVGLLRLAALAWRRKES